MKLYGLRKILFGAFMVLIATLLLLVRAIPADVWCTVCVVTVACTVGGNVLSNVFKGKAA